MKFEKALEAMKQGKKVNRKVWADVFYFLDDKSIVAFNREKKSYDDIVFLSSETILADDWEIYEEPQEGHETAIELLYELYVLQKCILQEYYKDKKLSIYGVPASYVLDFLSIAENEIRKMAKSDTEIKLEQKPTAGHAIEALDEKNERYKPKIQFAEIAEKAFESGIEIQVPDTTENQLKKEMRQALSRKFFKLDKEDYDVNADYELDNLNTVISNMLNIYQFLFPEGENK